MEVQFNNVITGFSADPSASFQQGRFVFDPTSATVNPSDGNAYPSIMGLVVKHPSNPSTQNDKYQVLYGALMLAEEIMTSIAAKHLTYFYLERPITCVMDGVEYEFNGEFFHEPGATIINGGQSFTDDLTFLDVNKNPRLIYHYYRAAQDELLPVDYRILSAWRFLEKKYKKQGRALLQHLRNQVFVDQDAKNYKVRPSTLNKYYTAYRCAVAHAAKNNSIAPRIKDTHINRSLHLEVHGIINFLNDIAREDGRIY